MNELPETLDPSPLGIDAAGITKVDLIHEKGGTYLYRVQCDGQSVVIKWFAGPSESIEVRSYALLEELGVPTLRVYGRSGDALVLEDLAASEDWRLATEADCKRPDVGRAVAEWYLKFHGAGRKLLSQPADPPAFLRREEDAIDAEAILTIGQKLGLARLPVWRLCAEHIELLKSAIRAQPATVTYNDFHWSNLALARAAPCRAIVFDYDVLGIGMAYCDYRNVLSCLRGSAAGAFKEVYGPLDEREAMLDAPVSILVALKAAFGKPRMPRWAQSLIQMAVSGELEQTLQKALEII